MRRSALLLGFFDHRNDSSDRRIPSGFGNTDFQSSLAINGPSEDSIARRFLDWQGFSRDGRLIHGGISRGHFAIESGFLTRFNENGLTERHL